MAAVSRGPAEKVTAANITDEQIASLAEGLDMGVDADVELYDLGVVATHAPIGSMRREQARARCAEILNARAEAMPLLRRLAEWAVRWRRETCSRLHGCDAVFGSHDFHCEILKNERDGSELVDELLKTGVV